MVWLLPAAGCSIAIALILKLNEVRGGNRLLLIGANYVVASLLSLAMLRGGVYWPGFKAAGLGVAAGIDFVLGFLLMMAGISMGPLAVPVTVMRLSVAVPIVASILIWNESPGVYQWSGIGLGTAAIVLFGKSLAGDGSGPRRGGSYWFVIVSLFFVMGAGDLLLKAYREMAAGVDRMLFTWILFSVAAVFAWVLILIKRVSFDTRTFVFGMLLGVPNLFSTVFILRALQSVPASAAFPFVNLVVILGSTLLGLLLWKEKLERLAIVGLALAAAAVVLLPL